MKKTFAAIAACMVACAAQASGFYVGGEVGAMTFKDWTQGSQLGAGGSQTTSQDTMLATGRIFGGYNINPIIGIELGYMQMNDAKGSITGTSSGGQNFADNLTYKINGFDLSAVVHPFESSRNADQAPTGFFLRAGVTQYTARKDETYSSLSVTNSYSFTKTDTGTILGLGYDWKLGPGALRLDATLNQSMANITNNDSIAMSAGYLYAF